MKNILVILAAGSSSRMKESLTSNKLLKETSFSKALIGMDHKNSPFLDYVMENARAAGYNKAILVVSETAEAFKNYYCNKSNEAFEISFATQFIPSGREKPWGTADALLQAMNQFPELKAQSFSVCNADNLYSVRAFKKLLNDTNGNAFISYDRAGLKFSMERIATFALVVLDAENYLQNIVEKPGVSESAKYRDKDGRYRVSMNLWKLDGSQIYPYLKDCPVNTARNEKELPTAILNMSIDLPKSVRAVPIKEHVPDLTSKADIDILKKYIANRRPN